MVYIQGCQLHASCKVLERHVGRKRTQHSIEQVDSCADTVDDY